MQRDLEKRNQANRIAMLIGPHEDARLKELPLWVTLAWLNWIDIPASAEERNKNHYGKNKRNSQNNYQ